MDTDNAIDSKKRKTTTPNEPQIQFETCREYKEYMEGKPDDNSSPKHNLPPKDAQNISDLINLSDEDLLELVNRIGSTKNKSDIRIMYANGCNFTFDQLETIAKYKGFHLDNPNSVQRRYSISPNAKEEDEFVFFIERGKRTTDIRKITLSTETASEMDELLKETDSKIERSKIMDVILHRTLKKLLIAKKNGKFKVCYRPIPEERVL